MTQVVASENQEQKSVLNPAVIIQKIRENQKHARSVWVNPNRGGHIVLYIDGKQRYSGSLGTRMFGLSDKEQLAFRQFEILGDQHFVSTGFCGVIRSMNEDIPLTISLCCSVHETDRIVDFLVVLKTAVDLGLIRASYALEICDKLWCRKNYLRLIRMSSE